MCFEELIAAAWVNKELLDAMEFKNILKLLIRS